MVERERREVMAVFINAATQLSSCASLGDQVRVRAMRLGGGWHEARNELANIAEDWFGSEPAKSKSDFRAVCREVFRTE